MADPEAAEISKKVLEVREHLKDLLETSDALGAWCSDETIRRYLAARSWDVAKASTMLRGTMQWRLEVQPEAVRWGDVGFIAKTGRVEQFRETDHAGRLIVVMRLKHPLAEATPDSQLKFLIHMMERSCRHADAAGSGKLTWLLDLEGYSRKTSPPLHVSLATLRILQNHYPERLGHAIVVRPTLMFSWLWRAVTPFMDPVTRQKVTFVQQGDLLDALEKHMPRHLAERALTSDGFNHAEYSEVVLQEEMHLDNRPAPATQA